LALAGQGGQSAASYLGSAAAWPPPGRTPHAQTESGLILRRRLAGFYSGVDMLADREFIGAKWLNFLDDHQIPFAIRLREDLRVVTEDGCELTLAARLRGTQRTRSFRARLWAKEGDERAFTFAVKRLPGEWLIVVSNQPARKALAAYRKRWAIECMFADAKSRGLNIEDTRLTCPRKLDLLMAVVTLALAWAGRTAANLLGTTPPPLKSHGYPAQSRFRIGLFHIRRLLRTEPEQAADPWRVLASNNRKTGGVV
jgi:hypothetical protein